MSHEHWQPIPDFPGYEVSSEGRVRSFRVPRYLAAESRGRDHPSVWLMQSGRPRRVAVHRLVLIAFKGAPPEGHEGCHCDGNGKNNRLANLRWDTHENNMKDKRRHGTQPQGPNHPNARLSPEKVAQIRSRLNEGQTQTSIARACGVSQSVISQIKQGNHWSLKRAEQGGGGEGEGAG